MRTTGIWKYFLFGLIAAILPASASAAPSDAQACLDASYKDSLDAVVDICSRAIDAGTVRGALLAKIELKRARAFHYAARLDSALNDVDAALAIDPQDTDALVLRAKIYTREHQYGPAMRDVQKAISLKPETLDAFVALAAILYATDPNLHHRLAALQQELQYNADNWYARLVFAECSFFCFGHVDEGLSEINKVIAAGSAAVNRQYYWHRDQNEHFDLYAYAILIRANMYLQLDKFDLAGTDYDWLIAHWPKESSFYFGRGQFFSMTHKVSAALADYGKALTLDPYNGDARIHRATLQMSLNRDDEALKDIDIFLSGGATRTARAEALSYRSEIFKKRGEREAALEDLDQALGMDPDLVRRYQQRLSEAGYFEGQPDGNYSDATRNGVKACLIDPRC